MTDYYFLTDSIRISSDGMEYRDNKSNIFKQIQKRNWHVILKEYGWEKMPKNWIIQLNKYSEKKERNSLYGVIDCETDGDCFFHCIAHSLNEKYRGTDILYDSNDIRSIVSDNLTEEQYNTMINYYRIMKDADDFHENWDPYSINSIDEFKEKLKTSGNEYWGDYLLLQLLIETLHINIFILNSNADMNDYTIYNTLNEYNPSYDTIFLLYENMCHFKLIGYFNDNKMISIFNRDILPFELKKLYRLK